MHRQSQRGQSQRGQSQRNHLQRVVNHYVVKRDAPINSKFFHFINKVRNALVKRLVEFFLSTHKYFCQRA